MLQQRKRGRGNTPLALHLHRRVTTRITFRGCNRQHDVQLFVVLRNLPTYQSLHAA